MATVRARESKRTGQTQYQRGESSRSCNDGRHKVRTSMNDHRPAKTSTSANYDSSSSLVVAITDQSCAAPDQPGQRAAPVLLQFPACWRSAGAVPALLPPLLQPTRNDRHRSKGNSNTKTTLLLCCSSQHEFPFARKLIRIAHRTTHNLNVSASIRAEIHPM